MTYHKRRPLYPKYKFFSKENLKKPIFFCWISLSKSSVIYFVTCREQSEWFSFLSLMSLDLLLDLRIKIAFFFIFSTVSLWWWILVIMIIRFLSVKSLKLRKYFPWNLNSGIMTSLSFCFLLECHYVLLYGSKGPSDPWQMPISAQKSE